MKNQVFNFDKSKNCAKMGTLAECQLRCQQTAGCLKFSYFTKDFDNSNNVEKGAKREPKDCCLVIDTKLTIPVTRRRKSGTTTKKKNVISGPQFCPVKKTEENGTLFSGEDNV